MKKIYILALLFLTTSISPNLIFAQCEDVTIENLTNPGPFEVATLTEADGIRNGPNYLDATVYYPTNATPPYASIAIVPGFTALPSSVEEWGPFYASHGIVTIIIGTNSIFDFPEVRAVALLDALETMRQENSRPSSPLAGNLDVDKFAVSGWSMGGGAAQRAAVLDNSVKAVVAMCPYLNNPQLNHASPVLIFSGQNDPTAPPAQHANVHYNVTPSTTDKLLFEVKNGNHSVANTPNGGNGVVGKIALSWLKLYLEDNECYCPLLTETLLDNPAESSNIQTNIECAILSVSYTQFEVGVFPNPAISVLNIISNNQIIDKIQIYTSEGIKVLDVESKLSNNLIDVSKLSSGIYFVKISEGKNVETKKFVKQ